MTLLGGSVENLIPQLSQDKLVLRPKPRPWIDILGHFMDYLMIISGILVAYRFFINLNSNNTSNLLVVFFNYLGALIIYYRYRFIKGTYIITEKGLLVPDTWLTKRLIQWSEIVEIYFEKVTIQGEENDNKQNALRIILDTPWLKVNDTGMQDASLLLLSEDYDVKNLESFKETLELFKNQFGKAPDTLNERLRKQVHRSWTGRNKRIIYLWIDAASQSIFVFFMLFLAFWGLFGFFPHYGVFVTIVISFVLLLLLFYWLILKPYSIVAIRPHELGAVHYVPDDVVTNIRFVAIGLPFSLKMKSCEIIYEEGENRPLQVANFVQIHPEVIAPGELAHGIAQLTGNHIHSKGAIIGFSMGEDDQEYRIEIRWR